MTFFLVKITYPHLLKIFFFYVFQDSLPFSQEFAINPDPQQDHSTNINLNRSILRKFDFREGRTISQIYTFYYMFILWTF
jgi:hypothetical protein